MIKCTSVSLTFVSSLLAWCHPVYIKCYVTILESRPLFKNSVVTSNLLTIFYKISIPSIFSKLTRFCTCCQFLLQPTRHLTFLPRLNTLLLHLTYFSALLINLFLCMLLYLTPPRCPLGTSSRSQARIKEEGWTCG